MLEGASAMTIYLYKKTHNKTGLQYLGKTISKDPHEYQGSGVYWKRHITEHGYDVHTEILKECSTEEELTRWGLYYSRLWNVAESKEWANLMEENGSGGSLNTAIREKISTTMKGRQAHNRGKKQPHKPHRARSEGHVGSNGKLKGRVRPRTECLHCGKSVDEANFHRYHGIKCKSLN